MLILVNNSKILFYLSYGTFQILQQYLLKYYQQPQ